MLALVAAELVVPVLWSTVMIVVQVISAVYFCGLAWACRMERGATWPTQALPLLFGAATIATGLLLSLNLAPRFGATPAYVAVSNSFHGHTSCLKTGKRSNSHSPTLGTNGREAGNYRTQYWMP